MFKIIKAAKDTYITDKLIRGTRKTNANVGYAGSLNLFKLYGVTYSGSFPNIETSRILIQFDLSELKQLVKDGKIDVGHSSFWCKMKLRDVYGGQPTPANFNISVFPLSSSFDEGIGKDVNYYTDYSTCNWMSASITSSWFTEGCSKQCDALLGGGDFITSSLSITDTKASQYFSSGDEDLEVDVTKIVSATLKNEIPDAGFRISYSNFEETNNQTYFVKRFASSDSFDETKHPALIIGFDDSIEDDTQNLTFDYPGQLTLYNYAAGKMMNIVSGTTEIKGLSCMNLKLITQISGGYYDLIYPASQVSYSQGFYVTGSYQSTVNISSSDTVIAQKLQLSSSINFLPVWQSLDNTVAYVTGSTITVKKPERNFSTITKNYIVKILNVKDEYTQDEVIYARVNIFDQTSPLIKVTKIPVELPGIVVKNVYYQIRDVITGEIVVPFDTTKNSTKVSSDSSGMFFKFDASNLIAGRIYTFDVMIFDGYSNPKYNNISPTFKVTKQYWSL